MLCRECDKPLTAEPITCKYCIEGTTHRGRATRGCKNTRCPGHTINPKGEADPDLPVLEEAIVVADAERAAGVEPAGPPRGRITSALEFDLFLNFNLI